MSDKPVTTKEDKLNEIVQRISDLHWKDDGCGMDWNDELIKKWIKEYEDA